MKAFLEDGSRIFFLCDRKACDGACPHKYCTHTSDIRHAVNFDSFTVKESLVDFYELDREAKESVA